MTFRQEKHLRFLRRPLVTQGELWLVGEIVRYVSKNTAGETELELHVDQQTTRIYYPLLQTLEVMTTRGSQGLPLSIPFLGRNVATLNTEYDVTLCASSGRHVLRLIPRSPHSSSSEIQLTLEDFQPQEFSQIEKNGTRLIMNITTFTPNPEISAAQLELQIPPGTRVLYPLRSHPPGESRSELPEPNADRPASRP
jgi:outer membrane lipoprotein-sorting protein